MSPTTTLETAQKIDDLELYIKAPKPSGKYGERHLAIQRELRNIPFEKENERKAPFDALVGEILQLELEVVRSGDWARALVCVHARQKAVAGRRAALS